MFGHSGSTLWGLVAAGGFVMYPLILCSFLVWSVILERIWTYRSLKRSLREFHLEAVNHLLRGDLQSLHTECKKNQKLPSAALLSVALDRLSSQDHRLRSSWIEAMARRRQVLNQDLKQNLWILGTIGSAAPFIGLFGTVVGILRSFSEMARTGTGGFSVVAAGISESLIATAAGIVVAVISVMAYNAFQIRWGQLVLMLRLNSEEWVELLSLSGYSSESFSHPQLNGTPGSSLSSNALSSSRSSQRNVTHGD